MCTLFEARGLWCICVQTAAAEVQKITGGTLDYLYNNAAWIEDTRKDNNLDG